MTRDTFDLVLGLSVGFAAVLLATSLFVARFVIIRSGAEVRAGWWK